jgi:Xaa-Pro aminopeptidase
MKSIKNPSELNGMIACHLRDGAAYCHLLWELFHPSSSSSSSSSSSLSEVDIDERLTSLRKIYSPSSYLSSSFDTIAGVGPNGAIVHYRFEQYHTLLCPQSLCCVEPRKNLVES